MIPMYNPITNTIGTTDRPQKQPRTTKIRIDPQFKSFVKFNTVWNFKKVHAQHCKGHFAPMPHWKSATTEKTVCTVCGSQQIKKVIKYNPNEPRKHRPQVIKQSNKTYEVVFTGYISKKLLRVDNPDQDHKKATFENICLSCELGFNGKSINGLCPSCANNERSDVNTTEYDTHASSHARYIELWQQGQYDEVQSDAVTGPNMRQIEKVLRERDNATTIREFTEKYYLLKGMMDRRRKAAEAEQTIAYYVEMNKDTLFDVSTYERRVKEAGKNAFERAHGIEQTINPDLRECALSDVKNVPTNAEVIEVTRAKNHILSPSWPVLKAYKHNGDWVQYTAAFMAEMAQPGPIAEMKRIINKAKDHPVYLACFEKVGHCHRFLLLDWMNRLLATC